MTGSQQLILGEGAGGSGVANYIEDVFSTWLYPGSAFGSDITINNGIDLSTKTGMVWIKSRGGSYQHWIYDTIRGPGKTIASNLTNAQSSSGNSQALTSFTNTGFVLTGGLDGISNISTSFGSPYVSWTFRKQAKFFDVVTYTGTGSNRTIAHNLGSVPGCIIIKCTSSGAYNWQVYHRSLGATKNIILNLTDAEASNGSIVWNSTAPTSTVFSLGTAAAVNELGDEYVAYLFAHDAGGFGLTGTDNVISCGSTDGVSTVNLGYEPQWVLVKASSSTGGWYLIDNMRGWTVPGGDQQWLFANSSSSEGTYSNYGGLNSTGFSLNISAGVTYIYIAIRRGPMKTPTSGTSVFQADTYSGTGASGRSLTTLSAIYLSIIKWRTGNPFGDGWSWSDRLRGIRQLASNSTASETNHPDHLSAFGPNQNTVTLGNGGTVNGSGMTYVNYAFQRAPGFFDVVCYTGTGSATTVTHNLGVVPELMIVKMRSGTNPWPVYVSSQGATKYTTLNSTSAFSTAGSSTWNNTSPTASVFSVGNSAEVNGSGSTYVAYLFATVAGVSKVGSYTGDGTVDRVIDCGFTSGARFILLKKTSTTSGWYVYDTARGISSSGEASLLLNSTAAESGVADVIDPASVGFSVGTSSSDFFNESGVSYIFLAIA